MNFGRVHVVREMNRRVVARGGFSIIELMVATTIGMMAMGALGMLGLYTARSMAAIGNYCDMEREARYALDLFTAEVRQVASVRTFSSTRVVFRETDGTDLTYEYVGSSRTFVRTRGGVSKVLLTECDSMEFRLYQRNPIAGTRDLVATTDPAVGKAIEVSWYCSRLLKGVKANTDAMQTARVTIRKQKV